MVGLIGPMSPISLMSPIGPISPISLMSLIPPSLPKKQTAHYALIAFHS